MRSQDKLGLGLLGGALVLGAIFSRTGLAPAGGRTNPRPPKPGSVPATGEVPKVQTDASALVTKAAIQRAWTALSGGRLNDAQVAPLLAQWAVETAWGRSYPNWNPAGIKAFRSSWSGAWFLSRTREVEGGKSVWIMAAFRAYPTQEAGLADWLRVLGGSRHGAALTYARAGDARGFAESLHRTGYATDPAYGTKLPEVVDSLRRRGIVA